MMICSRDSWTAYVSFDEYESKRLKLDCLYFSYVTCMIYQRVSYTFHTYIVLFSFIIDIQIYIHIYVLFQSVCSSPSRLMHVATEELCFLSGGECWCTVCSISVTWVFHGGLVESVSYSLETWEKGFIPLLWFMHIYMQLIPA